MSLRVTCAMKYTTLILGVAILLGGTPALAEDFSFLTPAGRAFDIAAKKQFGAGAFEPFRECYEGNCSDFMVRPGRVMRCKEKNCGSDRPEDTSADRVNIMVNPRYLGLPEGHIYLECRYRINPIRFYGCSSWEGD